MQLIKKLDLYVLKNFLTLFAGTYPSDVTMVNWPQNDYFDGNLIDVSESEYVRNIEASKQLSILLWHSDSSKFCHLLLA